jgi:hypothetical protein
MSSESSNVASPEAPRHRWRFFRAGGVDQVRIERGSDLAALRTLDQKLWVALSCPVKGLEFDERTLELLDEEKDGHIRPPEVLRAAEWLVRVLKNPDVALSGKDGVALDAIDRSDPDGAKIAAAAEAMLDALKKEDRSKIAVADATRSAEFFKHARLNGDGVVAPKSIADAKLAEAGALVVSTMGGVADRSGELGFDRKSVEVFFAEIEAYLGWRKSGDDAAESVFPLGPATEAAFDAFDVVRAKIDDYFARGRIAAYDSRAEALVNAEESRFLAIAAKDMSITAAEVASLPLHRVEAGKPLSLVDGINPAWRAAVDLFRTSVVAPLVAKDATTLSEADWLRLRATFDAHRAWRDAKKGASVEAIGVDKARALLGGDAKKRLLEACDEDSAEAPRVDAMIDVERLVRYVRDFKTLLDNFVAFADFYRRDKQAIFQSGTLFLDGRSCELCFRVDDPAKHAALAAMSSSYLAYCDLSRHTGEKMTVACAFTAGDSDHLIVGRNGIFYDRKGRDWDATITKIVAHPISIGQAFFAPYKRFLRWIEEQVAKRAAAADASSNAMLTSAGEAAGDVAKSGAPKSAPKFDIGVVAALGVAVGGIATAFGSLLNAFFNLGAYMPIGLIGLLLLISGPSMAIAWLKLRQRNLGPVLDANGWALNGRVKVNIPLGGSLTAVATLPPGAERSLSDPFQAKRKKWPRVVLRIAIVLFVLLAVWESRAFDDATKFPWYGKSLHAVPLVGLETKTERVERKKKEAEAREVEEALRKMEIEARAKKLHREAADDEEGPESRDKKKDR